MAIQMTDQQLRAYACMDKRILVSAAAGSGKTAVLIQRVLRLLREGASLDRMLIITYTNAAAGELRDRLRSALTDDLDLYPVPYGRAMDCIENARISTIHTFGRSLLQEYFEEADVDAAAVVAGQAQTEKLLTQAWRDAMNTLLARRDPDFMVLSDCYDNRKLQELCIRLHGFMMSLDHPYDWFDRAISEMDKPFPDTVWYTSLLRDLSVRVQGIRRAMR